MRTEFSIEPLAEDAVVLRIGTGIDPETNARVHRAARALRDACLPGITDIAPAYATLLVKFDPFAWTRGDDARPFERIAARLRSVIDSALRNHPFSPDSLGTAGRGEAATVEIPVCYGGEFGPDLERVAAHARITPDEVIARHAAARYTVAMLGFAPGFPYLLGLDSALEVPRRADPRTRVPAGSVAIGGAQTGIYPRELPGGWHLIGRTPLTLFDQEREPVCLVAPGDRVRFRAIDAGGFAQLTDRGA